MASIFDFLNAVDPNQTMPRDQAGMQQMLQQRYNPSAVYGAQPSPGTMEQMQRALPPGMPPMTPPTPATGRGLLADMGAMAGGQLGMPPQQAPQPAPQQQMPGFMQSAGGALDGMQNFITQNRGALAGLGAAIQGGKPVGYGVLQGQELDKKRKDEEDQKTREKNFADATQSFIKDPRFKALAGADRTQALKMLQMDLAQSADAKEWDYKLGRDKVLDAFRTSQEARAGASDTREAERLKLSQNADARAQAEFDRKPGSIIKDVEDGSGNKTSVKVFPDGTITNLDGSPFQGGSVGANPYYSGKMNADQAKAATFADRMAASHSLLNKLDTINTGALGQVGQTLSDVGGNWLTSNDRQKFNQAKEDFINAVLRKESGAAIGKDEFARADKQYFPQPGEGPDIIAQKRANREAALGGIAREAGPNYAPKGGATAGGANRSSAIDEAKAAIAKGAPADAVKTRLLKMGVPQSELNF